MIKKIVVYLLAIPFFLLASCTSRSSSETSSASSEEVRIDGSSTVYPITEAVAEEFKVVQPDIKVTVGMSGTGGGFKKFIRQEIDINDASRPIKTTEIEQCSDKNIHYIELSVAYDGLSIVVNKENDWVDYLTVQELKKIWEPAAQAKITTWSQIREGWPDEKFNLYGPGVASGTYSYFTKAIIGEEGASRGDYTASEDDNVLVQGVVGDKNALGFFGMAYYEENATQLRLVGVDSGHGPIKPTMQTVQDGTYSPLSRPMFIYVSKSASKQKNVAGFVSFYLENVASLAADVGYVAMPQEVYQKNIEAFRQFLSEE